MTSPSPLLSTAPAAATTAAAGAFAVIPGAVAHLTLSVSDAAEHPAVVAGAARADTAVALDEMIGRHGPALSRLIHRLSGWQTPDCDDLLQDVFVAALRHADRFERRSALPTWLTRIAINAVRAERRRRLTSARHWLTVVRHRMSDSEPADHRAEVRDEHSRVAAAMRSLPAKYREVLVLRFLQEMELDAVAEALGLSTNAVAVRLHRAKQMVEAALRTGPRREER